MAPSRENPDRNFSADGVPERVTTRTEASRRKLVANRFRLFFTALIVQLSAGSGELWNKVERRLGGDRPDDPARPRQPGDGPA